MRKNIKKNGNAWKDWALVGTALGNIFQAFTLASTKNDLEQVKTALQKAITDRDFLENRLKDWQKAYWVLKNDADNLGKRVQVLESELAKRKQEYDNLRYELKKELQQKDEEIQKWQKEGLKHEKAKTE